MGAFWIAEGNVFYKGGQPQIKPTSKVPLDDNVSESDLEHDLPTQSNGMDKYVKKGQSCK